MIFSGPCLFVKVVISNCGGRPYTEKEFEDYYGSKADAEKNWEIAKREDFRRRFGSFSTVEFEVLYKVYCVKASAGLSRTQFG